MPKEDFETYKPTEDFEKYESLNNYLNDDKAHNFKDEKFDHKISINVSKETFEMWELLCENWGDVLGYHNESKIFEFAIVEALNVPIASLGGYNFEGWDIEK